MLEHILRQVGRQGSVGLEHVADRVLEPASSSTSSAARTGATCGAMSTGITGAAGAVEQRDGDRKATRLVGESHHRTVDFERTSGDGWQGARRRFETRRVLSRFLLKKSGDSQVD